MFYRWATTLTSFLIPGIVQALSLTDALAIARHEAVTLQALSAETRIAEAIHQQSSQAYLPTISADATWLRADSSLITGIPVPTAGIPPTIQRTDPGPVDGTVTGVQLTQPLFNADAIQLRHAASLKVKARRHAEQWGHQAIRLEVSRLYFNVRRQQQRVETVHASYRAARETAALAHASYREGLVSRIDPEQADAQLAAVVARKAQARAESRRAQVELTNLLGMAPHNRPDLSSSLPRPQPPVPIGDSLPRQDLQARKMTVRAAGAEVRASRAEWLPKINLLARQQWVAGNEPLDGNADGWLVAVNLQWAIFDGLGRQGRIAESRAKAQMARVRLEKVQRRINRELSVAMDQWETGWVGWQAARKATEASRRAERLALRRYQENIGSMTDLLAARARLDRQRMALIDAQYQAVLAGMNYYLQNGHDPILAIQEPLP